MREILILGAGGFGREVLSWLATDPACGRDWVPVGFIDDNPRPSHLEGYPERVVCSVDDFRPSSGHAIVCAVGDPSTKRRLATTLLQRGAEFLSYVHPSVVVGRNVIVGLGSVLCPRVTLTCDIQVGRFVTFNVASGAGHDVVVGDFCTISAFCDLTGGVSLAEAVFVGSQATLIPGVTVGEESVVGAGSVVIGDVRPRTTVFGNPAKEIARR